MPLTPAMRPLSQRSSEAAPPIMRPPNKAETGVKFSIVTNLSTPENADADAVKIAFGFAFGRLDRAHHLARPEVDDGEARGFADGDMRRRDGLGTAQGDKS